MLIKDDSKSFLLLLRLEFEIVSRIKFQMVHLLTCPNRKQSFTSCFKCLYSLRCKLQML